MGRASVFKGFQLKLIVSKKVIPPFRKAWSVPYTLKEKNWKRIWQIKTQVILKKKIKKKKIKSSQDVQHLLWLYPRISQDLLEYVKATNSWSMQQHSVIYIQFHKQRICLLHWEMEGNLSNLTRIMSINN